MYSFSCIIPPFYYILYYPRRAWAATGIVVCLFACLSVTHESAHLAAMALCLQHG